MSPTAPRFALQVSLRVDPDQLEAFLPLMLAAARAAVEREPECHAFHVGQSQEDPTRFTLFEVYSDAAALEFHHQQPHFAAFRERGGPLILEKSSLRLDLGG